MAQKFTFWQKLSHRVSGGASKQLTQKNMQMGLDQLQNIDPESYDVKKLELQQSLYVQSQWKKIDNELYQKAVFYEPTRIAAYYDYESMEFTPEISATLDIYMEESTTANDKGEILTINSDSNKIRMELYDLFYNRLDINSNLPPWIRNTVKYGDNFLYLKVLPNQGVIGSLQLPNIEITRLEPTFQKVAHYDNTFQSPKLAFYWKNKDLEFNTFEVAHFRLLGDDRRLPYGTSILEKARRIWKQLLLAEDAMLVYRVSRAPERRVYKVYVGNMDDEDIGAYVEKVANEFKRTYTVDESNGNTDTRYNQLAVDQDYFVPVRDPNANMPIDTLPGACIALDTKIPLLDGRELMLSEIIDEWDNGNRDLWVYSADPNTGKLAPGMITWAGITRKDADVVKITLDNGEEIITTPDHKWVHRTNGFVEAQDLNVGDSLMPFYRRYKKIKSNTNEYEQVWDSEKQQWVFTHRMVVESLKDTNVIQEYVFDDSYANHDKKIIHHVDHDRFNNNPRNLVYMNGGDHMKYHQSVIHETIWSNPELNRKKISKGLKRYINNLTEEEKTERFNKNINNPESKIKTTKKLLEWNKKPENLKSKGEKISKAKSTKEFKEIFSKIASEQWTNDEYRNRVFSKKQTLTFTEELYEMFLCVFETNLRLDKTLVLLNNDDVFMSLFNSLNSDIRSSLTNLDEFTANHVDKMLKQRGYRNFSEWKRVEMSDRGYINMRQWKYYVDKEQKEFYNHKIVSIESLSEKQDTGTITVDGNELYHNYHTFATSSGVFIKNSNLSEIADIEYIQQKLFAALRVPKAFLGFEDAVGDGKNLALLDIRFARAIHRVQKSIVQELNKIAQIHLIARGYEDDINSFELALNTPSTQSDILKLERWREAINLYHDAVSDAGNGFAAMSMTRAQKEILNMSEEEIKLDVQRQVVEKASSEEMKTLAELIKQSGMLNDIYEIYNINPDDLVVGNSGGDEREDDLPAGDFGGGGGSLDIGDDFGDDIDTSDLESETEDNQEDDNVELWENEIKHKSNRGVLDNFPFDNKTSIKENYRKYKNEVKDKKNKIKNSVIDELNEAFNEIKREFKGEN